MEFKLIITLSPPDFKMKQANIQYFSTANKNKLSKITVEILKTKSLRFFFLETNNENEKL